MALVQIASQPWGWVADTYGNGQAATTVTIENLDGTDATHYADLAYTGPLTSALTTNTDGTIPRYIETGTYNMTTGGTTRRVDAVAGHVVQVVREAPYNLQQDDPELGDGSNVRNLLQERINALETAAGTRRGFEILLPEGELTVETNTIYAVSNLTLLGRGKGKTILKQPVDTPGNRAGWSIIRGRGADGTTNGQVDNFELRDLTLEGNGSASNQIADQATEAGHNMIFYGAENHRIINVESRNSRQYGIGYEGVPDAVGVLGGIAKNIYMESVDLHHNGRGDYYSVAPAQLRDGLDVKSSDLVTMIGCRAWSNGEKGFDLRAHGVSLVNCEGWDNPTCSFTVHTPTDTASALDGYANLIGCGHKGEGAGFFFNMGATFSPLRAYLLGCWSDQSDDSAIVVFAGQQLHLVINGGVYRRSTAHGLSCGTELASLTIDGGAEFSENGGYGLALDADQVADVRLGRLKLNGNTSGTISYAGTSRAVLRAKRRAPVAEPDYSRANGRNGYLSPSSPVNNPSNLTPTVQRLYLSRFVPSEDITTTVLAHRVITAAGSNDAVHVGLYDSTGARLADSGAVTGKLNATGPQAVTIPSTTLTAGEVYYTAFLVPANGGTAPVVSGAVVVYNDLFGSGIGNVESGYQDSQTSLPATVSLTGSLTTATALQAVRES